MKYLLTLFFTLLASIASADYDTSVRSIAKIDSGKGYSSSFCYQEDDEHYFYMTTGHSYANKRDIVVRNFNNCKESDEMKGIFFLSKYKKYTEGEFYTDIGIYKVKKTEFAEKDIPLIVKISKEIPKKEDILWTYGCALGRHPSIVKLKVNSVNEWMIDFTPPPERGRSGSPVFNKDFTKVVGIIVLQYCDTIEIKNKVDGRTIIDRQEISGGKALTTTRAFDILQKANEEIQDNKEKD